ncbi:hypothetical protein EV714DRAFT_278209 [Schizophyllum commune]
MTPLEQKLPLLIYKRAEFPSLNTGYGAPRYHENDQEACEVLGKALWEASVEKVTKVLIPEASGNGQIAAALNAPKVTHAVFMKTLSDTQRRAAQTLYGYLGHFYAQERKSATNDNPETEVRDWTVEVAKILCKACLDLIGTDGITRENSQQTTEGPGAAIEAKDGAGPTFDALAFVTGRESWVRTGSGNKTETCAAMPALVEMSAATTAKV